MALVFLIILPFIGSLVAAFLPTNARNAESTVAGAIALIGLVQVALLFPEISDDGVVRQQIEWLPDLGLDFIIRIDGFAWLFAMLGVVLSGNLVQIVFFWELTSLFSFLL